MEITQQVFLLERIEEFHPLVPSQVVTIHEAKTGEVWSALDFTISLTL
jgi:hypothetical protein